MDNLLEQFRRISKDLSPTETLTYLSFCCPGVVKFTTTDPLCPGPVTFYTSRITIEGGGGSFVVTEQSKKLATDKVAQQAYDYLVEAVEQYEEEKKVAEKAVADKAAEEIATEKPAPAKMTAEEELQDLFGGVKTADNNSTTTNNQETKYDAIQRDAQTYAIVQHRSGEDNLKIDLSADLKTDNLNKEFLYYGNYARASTPAFPLTANNLQNNILTSRPTSPVVAPPPLVPPSPSSLSPDSSLEKDVPIPDKETSDAFNCTFPSPSFTSADFQHGNFIQPPPNKMIPNDGDVASTSSKVIEAACTRSNQQAPVPPTTQPSKTELQALGGHTYQPYTPAFKLPPIYTPGMAIPLSKVANLVNRFNAVYLPTKNPVSVINEVRQTNENAFTVKTIKVGEYYETTVKLFDVATFMGKNTEERQSCKDAFWQIYEPLKSLSKLLVSFKSVNTNNKLPSAILNQLILEGHKKTVKIAVQPVNPKSPNTSYRANITLVHFFLFQSFGKTQADAERLAAQKAIQYLKKLANEVTDSPYMTEGKGGVKKRVPSGGQETSQVSRTSSTTSVTNGGNCLTSRPNPASSSSYSLQPVPKTTTTNQCQEVALAQPANMQLLLYPRDVRLIELFNLFRQCNAIQDRTPAQVIIAMLENTKGITVENQRPEHNSYLAIVKVTDLGMFLAEGHSIMEAKTRAYEHLYEKLKAIDDFLLCFQFVYSPTQSPMWYVPTLIARHHNLVTMNVWPKMPTGYQAYITIGHLHYLNSIGTTEEEALVNSYWMLVEYLLKFTAKLGR